MTIGEITRKQLQWTVALLSNAATSAEYDDADLAQIHLQGVAIAELCGRELDRRIADRDR